MFNNISIPPQIINYLAMFMIIFFVSFAGALCAEQYYVIKRKSKEVKQANALMYSVVITFLTLGFVDKLIEMFGKSPLISIIFLLGCSSSKIIDNVFNGNLLRFIIKFSSKVKNDAIDSATETFNDNKNKKRKRNTKDNE